MFVEKEFKGKIILSILFPFYGKGNNRFPHFYISTHQHILVILGRNNFYIELGKH